MEETETRPGNHALPRHVLNRRWRVGGSWGLTIAADGVGEPDEQGRRPDDIFLGSVRDERVAHHIVALHNDSLSEPEAMYPKDDLYGTGWE